MAKAKKLVASPQITSVPEDGGAVETIVEDFQQPKLVIREDGDGTTMKPCSINALGAAASGGFIGALYGAGSKLLMHRGSGRLVAARNEALSSAKAFAVFGGVYAFASCVIQRLRNSEDLVTSGLAGCATGLVMGIGGGLQSALASAAMMGGFSVVIDFMGKGEAQAHALSPHPRKANVRRNRKQIRGNHFRKMDCLLCPVLPLPLQIAEQASRSSRQHFKALLNKPAT